MIKMPSIGITADSGPRSSSGLVENCSILWNDGSGAGTMLELELELASVSSVRATLSGGTGDVLINSPLVGKTRLCRVTLLLLLVVVKLSK